MLRPFKVGDYVLAGDVEGTVRAVGLFTTAIDTPDNVQTFVGNAKVMGGTIKNFSTNPYRRVDLTAQLAHAVDPHDAIRRLKEALPRIPNVVADPKPDVEILTFNERGPVLAVRPYVHTDHYWQVVLRHQQGDPRHLRRGGLSCAGSAFPPHGGVTDHRGAGRRELRRNLRWDCWTDCWVRCWAGWRRAEGAARAAGSGISSTPAAAEAGPAGSATS